MPEHIRALVVILVLATPVWWLARDAFSSLLPSGTFARWRNLWFLVTLALFLSHSYWLFAFLLIAMVLAVRRKEAHVVGLFFVLLFTGSPVSTEVPGFGLINYVLILDHYRLLTLAWLLPAALVLLQSRRSIAFGRAPTDYLVLGYWLLISVLDLRGTSFTNGARTVVTHTIDILLPYYAVSRSIRDVEGFKVALSGFVIAACLLAPLAMFESVRGWRLYTSVQAPLGLNSFAWAGYDGRAGLLRAAVSLGHPIVLGFVLMVALGFMYFVQNSIAKGWQRWLAWGGLLLGLLFSLSRGPWVGAMLLGLAIPIAAGKPLQSMVKMGLWVALGVAALSASSFGQKLLALLPFIGAEDAGSIDYRVELWSFVQPVVERHLWFGSEDYLLAPEMLALASIQGQGIPDLVNHYYQILLASGLIGLLVFCGVFVRILWVILLVLRRRHLSQEHIALGAALTGTLLAILATISTVSDVTAVPVILWSVLGLCVAYSMTSPRNLQAPFEPLGSRASRFATNN